MIMSEVLKVNNLRVDIGKNILNNINFEVKQGERLGIFGSSGCGKTMTVNAIIDLLPTEANVEGEIFLCGKDTLKMDKKLRRRYIGQNISMIMQDSINALSPYEKVCAQMRRVIKRHYDVSKNEAYNFALSQLEEIGLESKKVIQCYPHQLSGGMRQRVFIAMSLCAKPSLIIADEPTTSLDSIAKMRFVDLLGEISAKKNLAMIFISHDIGVLSRLCDKVSVMGSGEIVEEGMTSDILKNQKNDITRQIIQDTKKLYEV